MTEQEAMQLAKRLTMPNRIDAVTGLTVLAAALKKKDERIAELEAVVEKLPKTADGVPIVHGSSVWDVCKNSYAKGMCECHVETSLRNDSGDGNWDPPLEIEDFYDLENLYSTREAALAAKEASDE